MFHRFPKPVERRRLWLAALGIPSTTPEKKIKQYSVCEEHFKREDYKQKMHYASRKMVLTLKKTAVPSVFDTEAERSASSMPVSVIFILPWVIHCQHCNCNMMLVSREPDRQAEKPNCVTSTIVYLRVGGSGKKSKALKSR